jgi:kynureninase
MAAPFDIQALREQYELGPEINLMGHICQAQPKKTVRALARVIREMVLHPDERWDRTCRSADEVRTGISKRLKGEPDRIVLGSSFDQLSPLFFGGLDPTGNKILTHERGLDRLIRFHLNRPGRPDVRIITLPDDPVETLSRRLQAVIQEGGVAGVITEGVVHRTGAILPELEALAQVASAQGAQLLIDLCDTFNVVPFEAWLYQNAFLFAHGASHAQLGSLAWLYLPYHLRQMRVQCETALGRTSPFSQDPATLYAARDVLNFFEEQHLTVRQLREISLEQTQHLLTGLAGYDILTPRESEKRGGFIAIRVARAENFDVRLREAKVWVDANRDIIRLGPAPYTTKTQLDEGVRRFRKIVPLPR